MTVFRGMSRWEVLAHFAAVARRRPQHEPRVTSAKVRRVRIEGESEWRTYGAGESFRVPGNTRFDIEVAGAPYHYVCHFLPAE